MKISEKVVVTVGILFLISGLAGCGKGKSQTEDDIVQINTSYHGMERDPVYAFTLKKKDENWFLSASCKVGEDKLHYTSFRFFPITSEEADSFFTIMGEEGEIKRIKKYHDLFRFIPILDAPSRSTGITFTDGSKIEKKIALSKKTLDYLYMLADRHYEAAESGNLKSVSIVSSCTDYSASYMFSLDKVEDAWLFSFDAVIDDGGMRVEKENLQIDDDLAEKILSIVEDQQLLEAVMEYKKPEEDEEYIILDETDYATSFTFANDSRICAPIDPGEKLTDEFYFLAKYYQ